MYLVVLLITGVSFLLAPMQLRGQQAYPHPQEYLIRHYDIEDGLPVNSVNGMIQDDDGYLYISTYDGLVRYDGYEFRTFTSGNTKGLETNRIAGIIKSRGNSIWLFNEDRSVSFKAGDTFSTFFAPEIPGQANRIIEGTDGRFWVAGTDGVAFFNKEKLAFEKLKAPLTQSDTEIIAAGITGEVYVLNDSGLISWHNNMASLLLDINDHPILDEDIREIKQFEKNVVWLVGVGTILKYNTLTKDLNIINAPEEADLAFWNINQQGNKVYILTATTGFYSLDSASLTLRKLSVPVNSGLVRSNLVFTGNNGEEIFIGDNEVIIDGETVLEVPALKFGFLDREGSLWVGSETNGLYQIRRSSFINLTASEIPGLSNIYSVIQDRSGSFWACGLGGGIVRISDSEFQNWTTSNSSLRSNVCKFIFEDTDGTVYAGFSDHVIWIFDNGNWIVPENFSELPTDELADPEAMHQLGSKLLIGNQKSLIVNEDGKIRYFDATQPQELAGIQVFAENSKGIIFAGTSGNGLNRIEDDSFINYSAEDGILNSNIIRDIYLQSDDTLWIATENVGLNRLILDEQGAILSSASITTAEGLTHNSLHRIIKDPFGYLWISSNGGIMRISQKALIAFADDNASSLPLLSFNEKDGMINREANGGVQSSGILSTDHKLWFPNQRGVTIIDPLDFQVQQTSTSPKPVIESIELGDDNFLIQHDSIMTIPNHQRDLRVNFTAPNFAYQDRIHFSYKLEGVNQNWQSADQSRQAVFTALPAGMHRLQVRAEFINSEPVETVLMLSIPSRIHETNWFLGLMLISIAGFIWGGFKYRLRHLKSRERNLQQRVDEQTEELRKAAEQKQRFFTGITHELKTPLSLIVGPLDDMADQPESISPETIKDNLPLIHRNSHRLKHLVDQILDVSKLNADAIRLTLQPVDLVELTRHISGQFQSWLEQQDLTLTIRAEQIDGLIFVDAEAWERIIINLLSNAIKFSPKGSEIKLNIVDQKDSVQVSIKDEGLGISAEHQQKVFEYLYQVEGEKSAEGTGIGLYLVKGLVEEMGGNIKIQSEKRKGAEFIITLKKGTAHFKAIHTLNHDLLATDSQPHFKIKSNKETEKPTSITKDKEQILVVEDNHDFRNYLQSALEEKYSVITASNGKKALKILKKETPALIISDVMMPEMNGLEFVNALRKKDHFIHLPVIFLSAKNHDTDVEAGLSTGADIYLTKPIRSKMLLSQIEAVLRRERVLRNQDFSKTEVEEPKLVKQVREIIYRQLANPSLTTNMLADTLFISRAKLYAEWKKVSDFTLNDYIKNLRLKEAHLLLKEREFNVQEAAYAVGFSDANYFSTAFKKEFGYSPSEIKS